MKNITDKNTPSLPLGINKSFIRKKEKIYILTILIRATQAV